jgi:GNAT superfamily N-acetyltransferase
MGLSLRPATPADLEPLLALVDSVVAWLVARGRSAQWGADPASASPAFRERTAQAIAAGVVTVAVRDDVLVGGLLLTDSQPDYLPAGLVPDDALYVHTLVSDRTAAGKGAGALLLDHARSRAEAAGVPLALDHWAGSPELARLYDQAGFTAIGSFTLGHATPWHGTVRLRTHPAAPPHEAR